MTTISAALGALGWICLALLSLVLARLGRFYEARAGRGTYYPVFWACALGFLVGGLADVVAGGGGPGGLPSSVLAGAGVAMSFSAVHLFGLMLGGAN